MSSESARPSSILGGVAEEEDDEVGGGSDDWQGRGGVGGDSRNSGEGSERTRQVSQNDSIDLASGTALGFVNVQPTLTEQNADLLSFIAKKERKCLDLREGSFSSICFAPG